MSNTAPMHKTADKDSKPAEKGANTGSREQVYELLKGFRTVMLITLEGSNRHPGMHARPMGVAQLDEDCTLTFLTKVDSKKVDEVKERGASVVAQASASFLSINGKTEIVRDKERIKAVWKPEYKAWFPEGLEDPELCALVFHPTDAEVWDSTGTKGLSYLFEVAKALLTGDTPKVDHDQHNKVDLRAAKA